MRYKKQFIKNKLSNFLDEPCRIGDKIILVFDVMRFRKVGELEVPAIFSKDKKGYYFRHFDNNYINSSYVYVCNRNLKTNSIKKWNNIRKFKLREKHLEFLVECNHLYSYSRRESKSNFKRIAK